MHSLQHLIGHLTFACLSFLDCSPWTSTGLCNAVDQTFNL